MKIRVHDAFIIVRGSRLLQYTGNCPYDDDDAIYHLSKSRLWWPAVFSSRPIGKSYAD